MSLFCVETIIYLLLYNMYDFTFKIKERSVEIFAIFFIYFYFIFIIIINYKREILQNEA